MTATRQIKIWTVITHALIIVGAGHSIANFALIEIMSLVYFVKSTFIHSEDLSSNIEFAIVALSTLLGQLVIVYSLLTNQQQLKLPFFIVGLILLWTSIVIFYLITLKDSYTVLLTISCTPFLICNIIFLVGHPIRRLYKRILDI